MEQEKTANHTLNNSSHFDEMFNLATNQVDEAIGNALTSLSDILSSPCFTIMTTSFQNPSTHSLQPTVSIRCRSTSGNARRDGKTPFHHTIPRCSLPATKTDLVQYHSHSSSYPQTNQIRCRSSQNINGNNPNRTFDVQYSFSLNKPWSTKIDKRRHSLISIQNFVNELIEQSIRAAFLQIDYQTITNNNTSIYEDDTSCLLFDCSPSYAPVERLQTIHSYADQFIQTTIEQSIEDLSSSSSSSLNENVLERLSTRLTEDVITDALLAIVDDEIYSKSLLTDDEKHSRKTKKRSLRVVNNENNESPTSLYHQIRHRSTSAFRSITNNNAKRETVDSIVNNIAQQIYTDSFDELRRILAKDDGI